jgi:hypothetical protein
LKSIPPTQLDDDYDEQALFLSKEIRDHVVLADEALVDVVQQSMPLILTEAERDELASLATDKAHYDELGSRGAVRESHQSLSARRTHQSLYRHDDQPSVPPPATEQPPDERMRRGPSRVAAQARH